MKNNFFELIELSIAGSVVPSEYVTSIVIFSSIESPALQMTLVFNDKLDMKNLTPLKGGEPIVFSVVDQYEQKVDLNFTLTTIETLTQKESDSMVNVKAVSKNGLALSAQRVNASFEATPSDIVKQIAPFIKTTPTVGEFPITASGWSKTKLIQKLSSLAYNEKFKAMYMFYADLKDIYFKPLNEILSVKEVQTYTVNDQNTNYRYNIIEWDENKVVDIVAQAGDNHYDNTYVHYNPDTKRIYSKQVTKKDAATESASLGKGQSFQDVEEVQGTKIIPYIIEADGEFYPKAYNSMSFALYTKKMQALMNGDLNVQVGTLINVDMTDRYNKAEYATETAGLWLVEKVAYFFTTDEFKMKLQVTKNATYNGELKNDGEIVNPVVK